MSLRIFFVDDDAMILSLLSSLLSDEFQVETFSNTESCLDRLKDARPDIFLVDVSMPGIDGYEFCRRLKADMDYQDIPVIFISADEDAETRMLCYEAGGEDFIKKPFEPTELITKFKIAGRVISEKQALRDQAGYAAKTAMSAMTSMGELGVVLQFLSKSFACASVSDLGNALLASMNEYGLKSALWLQVGTNSVTMSEEGVNLPLEISVLTHARTLGRIFQFKTRCVFNFENITLLINNMPVEEPEICGRIRDNVALLVEGADARLRSMAMEQLSDRRREGIESALPKIHSALDTLHSNYRRNSFELTRVMLEYQEELMASYVHLGLTEIQEEELSTTANKYMQRMVSKQDESLFIVGQLEQMARTLEELLNS